MVEGVEIMGAALLGEIDRVLEGVPTDELETTERFDDTSDYSVHHHTEVGISRKGPHGFDEIANLGVVDGVFATARAREYARCFAVSPDLLRRSREVIAMLVDEVRRLKP